MPFHSLIASILIFLLVAPAQLLLAGQTPGQPAAQAPQAGGATQPAATPRAAQGKLQILVLEGQNALNSISAKTAVSPVVQVLDSLMQPVQGANVSFEVQPTGPGGMFGDKPVATARTDYQGQATAEFTPNSTPGNFTIKVTAILGDLKSEARIHQTNSKEVKEAGTKPPPKAWYQDWKWWALIGAGAGAGIAAAVILTNRDQTSTITIAPGGVTIGGPQ